MNSFLNKKSRLRAALFLVLTMIILSACGTPRASLVSDKVNVVVSFYPLYDFAAKIGGEHVNVINMVPAGVEPHDWSPKSRDIKNLSDAQVFLYLGAGFEGWVHDTLGSLKADSKPLIVETSKGIELIDGEGESHEHGAEEAHEGEEHAGEEHAAEEHAGEEHAAEEHADEAHADGHEHGATDPHVWLSPVNAQKLAENIKNALVQADSAHQADYEANYQKLASQLGELHQEYQAKLSPLPRKEIVVTHQSFGYLAKEYGLTQKAIMGLSPDAEPTSKDLQEILQFIKTNQVKYIFFEELVSDKLASTLAKDAGVETLVLNPLEGLTTAQLEAGADYVSVMRSNLNNLIKALQ